MMKIVLVFCVALVLSEARKPMPVHIQPCKRDDPNINDCFVKNCNAAMSYIAQGDPDYGIKTLLPLQWQSLLAIDLPPLHLAMKNLDVYGLENMRATNANIDFEKQRLEFNMETPLLTWKGTYSAQAKVGIISHKVEGDVVVLNPNGKYLMTLDYELKTIDGVEYANVTKSYVKYLNTALDFNLGGIEKNPILNEIWKSVQKLFVNEHLEETCGNTVGEFVNHIFNNVPFNEVFPSSA